MIVREPQLVEEVAEVYARALFEVASERGVLDTVREQLGQFVDALSADRQLEIFFVSPYFSTAEKKDGLGRMVEGADETFMSFLETLVERQRMPEIFHIRARYEAAVGRRDEAAAGRGDERGGTRRGDRAQHR